jgi:hypothetical protein
MNLALQLRRGLSAEIYKFKGTLAFWPLIIAPAFIPFINFMILWRKGDSLIQPGTNAWDALLNLSINPGNFLFPFFLIMLALLVNNIEYNANTWKQIYSQSLSRTAVYLSKVKAFLLMTFISLFLFASFTLLVGFLLRYISPDLGFEEGLNLGLFYAFYLKMFLTVLGMASIQFWISQQSKNLILPLGIGIAGVISVIILIQGWKYTKYHPYGYHIFGNSGFQEEGFEIWGSMDPVYYSVGLAIIVFILAGVQQVKRRIM